MILTPDTPQVRYTSMIGSFDTYSSSGLIVSSLSVGIEFDAYSLWMCGLFLSHQLSAPSNYELEPSGMTIWLFSYKLLIFNINRAICV